MMPSAARDPKTLAGGVDESQDRRLGAVELGFPLFMPLGHWRRRRARFRRLTARSLTA
jgi:hypothetical protein